MLPILGLGVSPLHLIRVYDLAALLLARVLGYQNEALPLHVFIAWQSWSKLLQAL